MLCPKPSVEDLSSILLQCCKSQNAAHILRLHAYLSDLGLKAHTALGNDLVCVLVETGNLHHAEHIFDRLVYRHERSWSSVIKGHTKYGDPQRALILYELMSKNDSLYLNEICFVSLMKACAALNNLERGLEFHVEIARRNFLDKNSVIGSSLIQMYASCHSLGNAQDVFHNLVERDVCLWNVLIRVFVQQGYFEEALSFLHQMQEEGTSPDAATFILCLKACSAVGAICSGFYIHSEISMKGYLEGNNFVGSALVDMYAKCGALGEAKDVIENLPFRDTFTWTALLVGYAKHGYGEKALECHKEMQQEGIPFSAVTYVCSLKACISIGALDKAQELHAEIARIGLFENSIHVCSTLVDMYSKCGSLRLAQEVFDGVQSQNAILWNALIAGYAEQGLSAEAFYNYEKMQLAGFSPDSVSYICSLKACTSMGDMEKGCQIHAEIVKRGLESDLVVGTALVDMYVKTSSPTDAQDVLDMMPFRNSVTWNALVAGYAEQALSEELLACYELMHLDSVNPDAVTFIYCIKVCSSLGVMEKGQVFHAEATIRGMEVDVLVGGTLIDMYCKFGLFAEALTVFYKLLIRDEVSWNALIAGCLDAGYLDTALRYIELMENEGISRDAFSLVCGLKVCGSIGMTGKGQEMHIESVKKGLLERDNYLSSALIYMYTHCGSLTDAQAIVNMLQAQSVVSWNALMTGFVEQSYCEEVLNCYEHMQQEGIAPDEVTFLCTLKACGMIKATKEGQNIHSHIVRRGLERDVQLGSTLIDMYGKLGFLADAEEIFKKLPVRNVVSWNVLIGNFLEHGISEQVLSCFEKMENEGTSWDAGTAVFCLKAWTNIGSTDGAQKMHARILRKGLENVPIIGNTLIDLYGELGLLSEAQDMFHKIPVADKVAWNAFIAGYVEQGQVEEAFYSFEQMQSVGICPDAITFTSILKACGCQQTTEMGRQMHAEIVKRGLLEDDVFIDTALVDMYVNCGLLADVQEGFEKLPLRNLASWNALLTGYLQHGLGEEALNLFNKMQCAGIVSDTVTAISILKACGYIGNPVKSREVHAFITKIGLDRESVIGNTLVDVYDKCDSVLEAKNMFDRLPDRDIVSWTTLIAGYAGHKVGEAALNCFEQMQKEGVPGSAVTFVCSLKACGSSGALIKGQILHSQIAKLGLENESHIGNTLVDMYSKCGLRATMQEVFDRLVARDIIAWNSLVAGYAHLGESEMAFRTFNHLSDQGIEPDMVTFTSLLNACSNAGLVDMGRSYFQAIKSEFGCVPTLDHYTCMVDLLGRAGSLGSAISCIEWMPFQPGILLWQILLGACRKWGDARLGKHAFDHAVWLDANAATAYICLFNLYADVEIADSVLARWVEKNVKLGMYGTC